MSQHYGKALNNVPYSHLRVGMKVIGIPHGAGVISKLEERQDAWDDNRVTINWQDMTEFGVQLARYHNALDYVVCAEPSKADRQPDPEDSLVVPHTYGGFRGSFYVMNNRAPTEQEIFDAGMRAGRDVQWLKKHYILGELEPEGLTLGQKVVALASTVRFALLAMKRIAEGHEDPAKYAELTIKHLDTPSSPYLISNELSVKDIKEIMDAIVAKNPSGKVPIEDPLYCGVALSELTEFTAEVLKRSKL